MATFDYTSHFFWRLALAHDPAELLQLELHPGVHCHRYRCPYCFGHGQALKVGPVMSAEEYEALAESLGSHRPTTIISGVSTEPLTHPEAAKLIAVFRRRAFPVGLYTKGYAMGPAVREALVDGPAECFVNVSVDAGTPEDYNEVHDIATGGKNLDHSYFETVLTNLAALGELKRKVRRDLKLRASILVFRELAKPGKLASAVEVLEDHVDIIRIAIAQDRNDGTRCETLPEGRRDLLAALDSLFSNHPKVAILRNTHTPTRSKRFKQCIAQRTQVTIDKSGNVFPCPQVAMAPYQHLAMGSIRQTPLPDLLTSQHRLSMFDMDVDREMKCRICDRKDEAVNSAVAGYRDAFEGPARYDLDLHE